MYRDVVGELYREEAHVQRPGSGRKRGICSRISKNARVIDVNKANVVEL